MKKEVAGVMLYDIHEIAKILDITEWSVRKFIRDGRMKAFRLGRKLWISDEDLKAYLMGCRVEPSKDSDE